MVTNIFPILIEYIWFLLSGARQKSSVHFVVSTPSSSLCPLVQNLNIQSSVSDVPDVTLHCLTALCTVHSDSPAISTQSVL